LDLDLINDIFLFLVLFLIIGLVMIFALKKHLFSIFDFWGFIILSETIIVTLFTYLYIVNLLASDLFINIILSTIFLILGLNVFYKKEIFFNFKKELSIERTIKVLTLIIVSIYILNTSLSIYLLGVPFISGIRRTISVYSEMGSGFGIIYYLDWGIKLLMTIIIAKLYIMDKTRLSIMVLSIFMIGLILNTGSRLVYLELFLFFIYAIHLSNIKFKLKNLPRFMRLGIYLLPFIVLFSFISAVGEGYESNVFLAFTKRLIGTAEGPFYYFVGESSEYISDFNILKYHFSQVIPYFGIPAENEINLGVNITELSTFSFGQKGFGPNPTFYVVGHIILGKFAFIYAFIMGSILSFIRYRLNKIGFSLYFLLNITAYTLIADGTLFSMSLFFVLIILIPLSFIIIQGYKPKLNR
jgi:hypothetical protein